MTNPKRSLDDLVTGIKHLLREDRCSFSEEEKILLTECIATLQEAQAKGNLDIVKILTNLGRVLLIADRLKDFF